MVRLKTIALPGRAIAVLLLVLATLLSAASTARAAGSRLLTGADIGDFNGMEGASPSSSISGAPYPHSILMVGNGAFITLFTHHFPGYAAIAVAVGVPDGSVGITGLGTLQVTLDGKLFKSVTKKFGQSATNWVIPFGHADQIRFSLHENGNSPYMLLGNPTVLPSAPRAPGTVPAPTNGKTTLQLFSASVTAGGQETALITTTPSASLTIVITYADGSQQVVGPRKAGPDGHFAYSWNVPSAPPGPARVVVVSAGVAQATFTIH